MNEPLLPCCPFCGAEISSEFNDDKNEATHMIGMTECFLTAVILTKKQWSTRVTPPPASIQWPDKRELIEKQDLSDFGMNLDDIYSHGEEIGFVNGANFMLEACKELNAPKAEPCWHDWLRPTPQPKSTKHCTKCGAVEQPSEKKESETEKLILDIAKIMDWNYNECRHMADILINAGWKKEGKDG